MSNRCALRLDFIRHSMRLLPDFDMSISILLRLVSSIGMVGEAETV